MADEVEKPFETCPECGHAWEAHSDDIGCVQNMTIEVKHDGQKVPATINCPCELDHGRITPPGERVDVTIEAPAG
jgi:hypothetical protein